MFMRILLAYNHYDAMFQEFLKRCGYTISRLTEEENVKKVKRDQSKDEENYSNIVNLDG